jgi:hypothetical protein
VKPDPIHHALIWLLSPGEGGTIPRPGDMPSRESGLELLATYSPAHGVVRFGAWSDAASPVAGGVARRLPAGAILLIDAYARPMSGREMRPALRIGVKYAGPGRAVEGAEESGEPRPVAPPLEARTLLLDTPAGAFMIGAGERTTRQATRTLTEPIRLRAITPYMRSRGTSLMVEAKLPARRGEPASTVTLLDARAYDWRWILRHELVEPLTLPAGTVITARAMYDNTDANTAALDPASHVTIGSRPEDESLLVALEYEIETIEGTRERSR